MGVMESIFGPEGIGVTGQGGVGDSMKELGKGLASLPVTLAKLPGDFARDPVAFFDDNGRPDLMAILLPSYRKQKVESQKQQQEAYKLELKSKGVDLVKNLFGGALGDQRTGQGRQAYAQALGNEAPGLDTAPILAGTGAEYAAAQQAASDSGMLPSVAAIASGDDAARAGQSQFTDRLAREQNVQQAGLTRGNQSHASALAAGNIRLRDVLAQQRQQRQPAGQALPSTASERKGLKSLKSLKLKLRGGLVPDYLRGDAKAALRAKDGVSAQQVNARMVDAAYASQSPGKILADPMLRDLNEQKQSFDRLRLQLGSIRQAASDPRTGQVREDLFSPQMSMLIPTDPRWQGIAISMLGEKAPAKQQLISGAEFLQSNIALAQTGKVANQTEQARLRVIGPTGNEPSVEIFNAKADVVDEAFERETMIREEQAKALLAARRAGNSEDMVNALFQGRYRDNLNIMLRQLEGIATDPNRMPDVPLTPEQLAEMGR